MVQKLALVSALMLVLVPASAGADWLFTPNIGMGFGGNASGNEHARWGASFGWMGEGIFGWQADLHRLPPMPPLADKFDRGERFMCLDSLSAVVFRGPEGLDLLIRLGGTRPSLQYSPTLDRLLGQSIDYDPAFRAVNRLCDQSVAAARTPDRAARRAEYDRLRAEVAGMKAEVAAVGWWTKARMTEGERGELVGKMVITAIFLALERVQNTADRIEQVDANLRVAFALARSGPTAVSSRPI